MVTMYLKTGRKVVKAISTSMAPEIPYVLVDFNKREVTEYPTLDAIPLDAMHKAAAHKYLGKRKPTLDTIDQT
jgi:hypothetical protein